MFDAVRSRFEATSAIIDLEGFSKFSTQPDNHRNMARYLNFVFERVEDSLHSARIEASWIHRKFLGDGALYIWRNTPDTQEQNRRIFLGLHNLFRTYPVDVVDAVDELNVRSVPRKIRVGIAQGEVSELSGSDGLEYVGFSINLASRLQNYCPDIGFIVSSSVSLPVEFIEAYSLVKVRTKKIKGMAHIEEDVRYVLQDALHLRRRDIDRWFIQAS